MADAIVYATARQYKATLYTSDSDLKDLPGVQFIAIPGSGQMSEK